MDETLEAYGLCRRPPSVRSSIPSSLSRTPNLPHRNYLFSPLPALPLASLSPPSLTLSGYDCPPFLGVYDYRCAVAGASLSAAESILRGDTDVAINWYGGWHHARKLVGCWATALTHHGPSFCAETRHLGSVT